MNTNEFDYELPESLIANHPCSERSQSKLFVVGAPSDEKADVNPDFEIKVFADVVDELNENDLLIFNDTKVIPARLFGYKESGGKVEIFLERIISETQALVQMRASKTIREGQRIEIFSSSVNDDKNEIEKAGNSVISDKGDLVATIVCEAKEEGFYRISFDGDLLGLFETYGKIPLPPYIERKAEADDFERYQTVYAKNQGAVAAPTAGLHFDEALMSKISDKGIEMAYVTLHIGAGTFQPVRVDNIKEHEMHRERFTVPAETIKAILKVKENGGRVVAVGTTTVRALETMMQMLLDKNKSLADVQSTNFSSESQIFIYPGYRFLLIEGLITNFHLPRSTLIMMVCAFAGYNTVMNAYRHAVNQKMRFYSYGDAMLLWRA